MKESIRRHRAALMVAFLVLLLHSIHHLALWRILTGAHLPYEPTLIEVDDRYHSIAKIKEVFLHRYPSGDVALAEYKNALPFLPPLPQLIAGYLAKLLGSIKRAFIMIQIFFPVATFLLFYLLFFEFTKTTIPSIFFATFSLIMLRYLLVFPIFTADNMAWFFAQIFNNQSRLRFIRFDDPALTAPFFLLALYLIARSLNRMHERPTPYLAGIAFGVVFYVYTYYSVYLSVAICLMGLFFLLTRRSDEFKKILRIAVIGFALSLFYWIPFFSIAGRAGYKDIALRIGPERSFKPFLYPTIVLAYFQHTLFAGIAYVLLHKKYPHLAGYFAGIMLAVFAVYNFQIITGFNPQPDHWIKPREIILNLTIFTLGFFAVRRYGYLLLRTNVLVSLSLIAFSGLIAKIILTKNPTVRMGTLVIALVFLLAILNVLIARRRFHVSMRQIAYAMAWIGITLLFIKGVLVERQYIRDHRDEATLPLAEMHSLTWLADHTPPDSVIGTPSVLTNELIMHFTPNRVFIPDGFNTIATNREILERFFLLNRLLGVPPYTFGSYFATKTTLSQIDTDHQVIAYLFSDQYRATAPGSIFTNQGYGPSSWSEEMHQNVVEDYARFLKKPRRPLPYQLDYLYYGPRERALVPNMSALAPFKKIYDQDGIMIYRYTRLGTAEK